MTDLRNVVEAQQGSMEALNKSIKELGSVVERQSQTIEDLSKTLAWVKLKHSLLVDKLDKK